MEKYCKAINVTRDNITRRMHFAFWIIKTTDTRSEYVTHIAFPRHQLLRERAPILPYAYIACLVYLAFGCVISMLALFFSFVLVSAQHHSRQAYHFHVLRTCCVK